MIARFVPVIISLMLFIFSFVVLAESVSVVQGHIRETIPGTKISSAYFTLKNSSDNNIALVHVTSEFSERIELHQHTMDKGMMKMDEVKEINIPAKGKTTLQPFGFHLMIFDLEKPLTQGEQQKIKLMFNDGSSIGATLPVKSIKHEKTKTNEHSHHH